MKRYSIDFYGDKMVEDKDGEYVKYDDAQKIREAYYGAWENAVVSGLLEIDLRDELEQQKYAFDNMQKLYLEIIVAANDNAEKLDRMTARCKAAEEVLSCVPYRNKGIGEHNAYLPGMDEAVKEHRDIITAYDKAVNKIQGENK